MTKTISLNVPYWTLIAAAAVLVAAKIAGAPIPWFVALLPIWILLAILATVLAVVGLAALVALLVFWRP